MLDKKGCNIQYDADGKAIGVESDGEVVKGKLIICDPSYAEDKSKKTGQVCSTKILFTLSPVVTKYVFSMIFTKFKKQKKGQSVNFSSIA